jgi:periplasmic divalent cation tolerance protein
MRVIFSTCSPAEAEGLAERLLAERLIGCANLVPGVRSLYRWEGELCRDEEVVLLMETTADRIEAATERLRALHSYDVPKIIVIDPAGCDPEYRSWLEGVIGPA